MNIPSLPATHVLNGIKSLLDSGSGVTNPVPVGPEAVGPSAPVQTPNAVKPVTDADISRAVSRLNNAVKPVAASLEFALDDSSGRMLVRVTDKSSGELIRQIPTEQALAISEDIERFVGKLLNGTA